MIDLSINQDTLDLDFGGLDLKVVENKDQILQLITKRLRFFRSEWFLDVSAGTPYFNDIFVKNPNIPSIENIFIAMITETEGVNELIEFDLQQNPDRSISVSFKVNTIFGTAESENTILVTV